MGKTTIHKEAKERQSNIELCRILSILLVVLVHSQIPVFGYPRPHTLDTYLVYGIESFSIIGVNVFILISGYFSIRLKIKNIANLIYICFFYMMLLNILRIASDSMTIKNLFFISQSNWFIPRYIGLMIMSPVLNAFCDHSEKRTFKYTIIALTLFSCYWGFLLQKWWPDFHKGYSLIHFCILYLTARYFKIYGFGVFNKINPWLGYISCSLILTFVASFLAINGFSEGYIWTVYDYINPVVLLSSIFFFNAFVRLNIPTNKNINIIAQSTLAILLLHSHKVISEHINTFYRYMKEQNLFLYLLSLLIVLGSILLISIMLDQIRIKTFNYLYHKLDKYGISNTTL